MADWLPLSREAVAELDAGLALILIFIGARFLLSDVVHMGPGVSLGVIVVVIGAAIAASLLRSRRPRDA